MSNLKIGLLPLYIKLYDDSWPYMRERVDKFYGTIATEFEKRGLEVVNVPMCRVREEFTSAVGKFEDEKVDAIVTLHLAYSPSLESADILAATKLPIVVLDTTPTYDFGPWQNDEEISYNHGIHGVQDMCNLLVQNNKEFFIECGHWEQSDVIERAAGRVRGIKLASNMCKARIGRVGNPFKGMGDFDVPLDRLRSDIGIETVLFDFDKAGSLLGEVGSKEIEDEMAYNLRTFEVGELDESIHRNATKVGLAIRKWLDKEKLTAFTINFMDITKDSGFDNMPFVEISKAMARGIGYAGEGDVLTAALAGALASVYHESSFVEMFCPDWKNGSIFLSHMGEMNLNLAAGKPRLMNKEFPFTDADDTVAAYGRFKEGRAVYVDLAPVGGNAYSLIVADGQMLDVQWEDKMKNSIHGWFKPDVPITEFLKRYSLAGGTHHSALVYGDVKDEIIAFGNIMNWNIVDIV